MRRSRVFVLVAALAILAVPSVASAPSVTSTEFSSSESCGCDAAEGFTCDFCQQAIGADCPIGNTSVAITGDVIKRAQLTMAGVTKTVYASAEAKEAGEAAAANAEKGEGDTDGGESPIRTAWLYILVAAIAVGVVVFLMLRRPKP